MKIGYCSSCGRSHEIKSSFTGKLVALGLSGMVAPKAAKNPFVALLIFGVSMAAGHYIDKEIEKECPECGAILKLLSVA